MKLRLLVFAALLPLVLVAPVSNAAVKAGSACTKQGVKQISGAKSFTCVKQGKKLVWNKGVAVKKPAAPVVACAPEAVLCNERLGFLPRSLCPTRVASTDRNAR